MIVETLIICITAYGILAPVADAYTAIIHERAREMEIINDRLERE